MKKIKQLSAKNLEKRRLTLKAIEDYFGAKIPTEKFDRILLALKKGSTMGLDEEERSAVYLIDANLRDPVYIARLKEAKNPVA